MKRFTNSIECLKLSWDNLMQKFQVEQRLSEKVFINLVNAYSGAYRYYHKLRDIQQILEIVEQMRSLANKFSVIQLSARFHDIIYALRAPVH